MIKAPLLVDCEARKFKFRQSNFALLFQLKAIKIDFSQSRKVKHTYSSESKEHGEGSYQEKIAENQKNI